MKYHTLYRHLAENTLIFLNLVQFIKTLKKNSFWQHSLKYSSLTRHL